MELQNQDFKEFIALLNAHEVKYLVVGGYAVVFHGHPRYTGDIDFWIWMDAENAQKVVNVLRDFGFGSLGATVEDFTDPNNVMQLGYPPSRIDLITTVSGLYDFEACFQNRIEELVEGVKVNFIGYEDLITNKKASGRPKDLGDIDGLK